MNTPITRRGVLIGAVASATVAATNGTRVFAGEPTIHEVQIKKFKFKPKHITVKVGDVIRWTNTDLAPHTATAKEFGWDTEEIAKGESKDVLVSATMETQYFCAFHPQMKGVIEIE